MVRDWQKDLYRNGASAMNDVQIAVRDFARKVSSSGIPVSDAILFGSWARGTATSSSDIDVCIVSPKLGKDWVSEIVSLRQLALGVDRRIEPVPLNPRDMHDKFHPLANEINKFGIKISV